VDRAARLARIVPWITVQANLAFPGPHLRTMAALNWEYQVLKVAADSGYFSQIQDPPHVASLKKKIVLFHLLDGSQTNPGYFVFPPFFPGFK
jgi:hypothetical protein